MSFFILLILIFLIFFLISVGKIAVNGVKLIFWDLGGQLELRTLWHKVKVYFRESRVM